MTTTDNTAAAGTDANAGTAATTSTTSTTSTQGTALTDAAGDAGKSTQQADANKTATAAATTLTAAEQRDYLVKNTADGDKALTGKSDADVAKLYDALKKTEGDKAKATDGKDAGKTAAPEKYEDFKLPGDVKLDEATMTEFTGLAKELGLSQEQAQKLAELGTKKVQGANDSQEAKLIELAATTATKWGEETKVDKEFGGAALDENLGIAKAAVDAYASPELKALLGKFDKKDNPNGTGLGNHPEVVRLFYRLGKTISSDTKLHTGEKSASSESLADRLYGKPKT